MGTNYLLKPDSEQRELVKTLLNKNMLVEAGAGAGKSTIIVERIINQFKNGFLPKELVAITFTKAATEELRGRIIKQLQIAIAKEKDENVKETLVDAFNHLYQMNISTIHSFANTLLTEKSLQANLPVGVKLLEDASLEEAMETIFNRYMKSLKANDWDLLTKYNSSKRDIKDNLYKQYKDYINKGEDITIVLPEIKDIKEYVNEVKEKLEPVYDYFTNYLACDKEHEVAPTSDTTNFVSYYESIVNKEIFDLDNVSIIKRISELLKIALIPNPNASSVKHYLKCSRKKTSQPLKEEMVSNEAKLYQENLTNFNYLKNGTYSFKYLDLANYAYNAYKYYLDNMDKKSLTNNQLLTKALELVSNKEARDYFASKYRCIYVDEFQDTDRVQAKFIWLICLDPKDNSKLRDGSLFVVGDPKQSIYRFRGADPEVYFKVKEDIASLENGEVFFFSNNFRSNSKIIDSVNNYYNESDKPLIKDGKYNNMEVPSNHIVPTNDINYICLSGVYKARSQEPFIKDDDPKRIANIINELVNNNYGICKDNPADKYAPYIYGKVEYEDILVILGKHSGMDEYVKEFDKYGIPVTVIGEVSISNEVLIKIYLAMLRGLICLKDDLAIKGAIEAIRANINHKFNEFKSEKELEGFFSKLYKSLVSKTNNMSAYGKAYYLLNHLEWVIPKNIPFSNASLLSIQTKLQQMLETNISANYLNGIELLNKFDDYVNSTLKCELALSETKSVRIMNVHNSKGLEGEIVIWGNLDTKRVFEGDSYRIGNTLYPKVADWVSYKDNENIYKQAKEENDLEVGRLEYVGITRAKQVFIFSEYLGDDYLFTRKEGYNYHIDLLDSFNYEYKDYPDKVEFEAKKYDIKENDEYSSETTYSKLSPSLLDNLQSSIRNKAKEGLSNKEIERLANDRPVGAILGTIMHRSLELLLNRLDYVDDSNLINAIIKQAISENKDDVDDVLKYQDFLLSILPKYLEYLKDNHYLDNIKEIHCELPYSFYDNSSNSVYDFSKLNTPIWLNGTMDLLLIYNDNRYLIIDYKSDLAEYINDEETFKETLLEKYKAQLDLYKKSVMHLYNVDENKVQSKIIYFRHYNRLNKDVKVLEANVN